MHSSHVDADHFRTLLSRFASGVTVVTARDAGGAALGMTVSAFSSLSLEPPLILVCIERAATLHGVLIEGTRFVVNILAHDQEWVSRRFADIGIPDRFEGIAVVEGVPGPPRLRDAIARLQCVVTTTYEGGDHTIVVGQVVDGDATGDRPLVYFGGDYRR